MKKKIDFFKSSSNAGTLNSKASQKQWILSNDKHKVKKETEKNLCLERIRDVFAQNFQQIRYINYFYYYYLEYNLQIIILIQKKKF